MASTVYPKPAALLLTTNVRTLLALSTMHLVKAPFNPSPDITQADLVEADFSGYAAKTLTAWGSAYYPMEGGAAIRSGEQQFNFVAEVDPADDVTNIIYGWYIKLVTPGLQLFVCGDFDVPHAMGETGDATFVNVILGFGASG